MAGAIIKAFEAGPRKRGMSDDDPRKEAAKALMSALKSGNVDRFLSALDSISDLRGDADELGPIEDDMELD